MKWSDLKLMAIGGCCLSVFILKKDRIPGPVDNTLLFNVESIKLLLDNDIRSATVKAKKECITLAIEIGTVFII